MYAHQVIEDLNKFCELTKDEGCRKFCKTVPEAIRSAQKFHTIDIRDYNIIGKSIIGKAAFSGETAKDVQLPYPITWFDYNSSLTGQVLLKYQAPSPKRAGLLLSLNEKSFILFMFSYLKNIKLWVPFPYQLKFFLSENAGGNVSVAPIFSASEFSEKDVFTEWAEDYRDDIGVVNLTLMLLNCKNITTERCHPDAKLQKARKKRGKLPLFSYHTLVIKPTGKRQESIPKNLWDNRVHLCRGHFKTYTEDKPLFGHITGRFWWQPTVRGRNREGVVMKDYELRTA